MWIEQRETESGQGRGKPPFRAIFSFKSLPFEELERLAPYLQKVPLTPPARAPACRAPHRACLFSRGRARLRSRQGRMRAMPSR